MKARSSRDVDGIRGSVEQWSRVSDRLFSVGGFGVGLDGILTWIPGIGGVYSLGVGGFLLVQAHRARASRSTMTKMALMLGTDALIGEVPIIGYAFDFLFRSHARSARILLKEIERTHYADESAAGAQAAGRLEGHRAAMRAAGRKRLVFLQE